MGFGLCFACFSVLCRERIAPPAALPLALVFDALRNVLPTPDDLPSSVDVDTEAVRHVPPTPDEHVLESEPVVGA